MCSSRLPAPALRASAPPALRPTAVTDLRHPAGQASKRPLACPASRVSISPGQRITPRSPSAGAFVRRCFAPSWPGASWPARKAAHASRRLLGRGLPGPAKVRRAYAEQNAPLLLFFRLLMCRQPLTRAAARLLLLLVVLISSKSKGVLFIWLSRAGQPRQRRPWARARAESARLNLACPSGSTAAFPGAGKRRLGSTAFPAWPRVLLPACHGACCHALHITPHYANALYSRAKALP